MAKYYPDRIFLCHSHEDGRRVQKTYSRLQAAGLSPWIDKRDIPPASEWDNEIRKNLQAARFVVIFLSSQLLGKNEGYVQKEIKLALSMASEKSNGQLLVLIARLDDSYIPSTLDGLTSVDLAEADGDERLAELIKDELHIFTDPRDNQMYRTIRIGDNIWFAENLNSEIADSWWYDEDPSNARPYGRLYTWQAARSACPPGWHIPNDSEWRQLAIASGGYRDMDEGYPGTGQKVGRPKDAFDVLIQGGRSGFDALLGGYRDSTGQFKDRGRIGLYWSGTPHVGGQHIAMPSLTQYYLQQRSDLESAWVYYFYIFSNMPELRRDSQFPVGQQPDPKPRSCGLSVRCLKNIAVRI